MEYIKISLDDLKALLRQQKEIVADRLLSETYLFNTESTSGHSKTISNIDTEKFKQSAMGAKFPNDVNVLLKYLA